MSNTELHQASPWRWVVLGAFMGVNLTIQTLWISFSPIAGPAATFYGVDDLRIGFFAMSFMIAFVPLSIPVSWCLDRFGFRPPVAIASLLMGVFGVLRGLAGADYPLAMLATVGIAATQPFLLNSWTQVPAAWFPRRQRASAVGLVTLANLVGTAAGMLLPPALLEGGIGIGTMQTWFGLGALVSGLVFLLLARGAPAVPPDGAERVRVLMLDGLRHALRLRAFWYSLAIAFIGLGIFNGITTWVEAIIRPRGFSPGDAGNLGALLILGGLIGAVLIPALSDREGKRRKYLLIALAGCLPGLLGLAFATEVYALYAAAFVLGFFLVSALPITMQYAAEISRPTPEGTSNGLLQLFGQGAVVFVYLMAALRGRDGSFTPALLLSAALVAACFLVASRLPEPTAEKPAAPAPGEG